MPSFVTSIKHSQLVVGTLPRLPYYQDLTEDQKQNIKEIWNAVKQLHIRPEGNNQLQYLPKSSDSIRMQIDTLKIDLMSNEAKINSLTSLYIRALKKKHSVSFSNTVDYVSESHSGFFPLKEDCSLFGSRETTVFMTLYDDIYNCYSSGTQATASLNKSLQVDRPTNENNSYELKSIHSYSNNWSTTTSSKLNRGSRRNMVHTKRNPEVYFFGNKKSAGGMGKTTFSRDSSTQSQQSKRSTSEAKTNKGFQKPEHKTVSIKDGKPACPAVICGETKGDLIATVSHIKIAPREGCPIHGKDPCQGPNCVLASAERDNAPVKVTTANNPRRGVFEVVIRRLTGAPLARNELMLEWTPPPCRAPTCGPSPCSVPCSPLSKCKMLVCRPAPCKPKYCKRACKRPCGPSPGCARPCGQPCRPVPCRKCSAPCRRPRRPCSPVRCRPCPPPRFRPCPSPRLRPCPPPRCLPCDPSPPCTPYRPVPCAIPRCNMPCSAPCKSTPCLRPCPIGRGRRARKARSSPKIRSHRKKLSPCLNRTSGCPMSRCCSLPGSCFGCRPCPPRKCSSIGPCRPSKYFKTVCSTCC